MSRPQINVEPYPNPKNSLLGPVWTRLWQVGVIPVRTASQPFEPKWTQENEGQSVDRPNTSNFPHIQVYLKVKLN